MKYIFITGGVMSGVGKGIATSSIGKILSFHNLKLSAIKIDPYVNVDAGTMNPTEHGETFVLDDGHETDQDMGNYERFLDINLTKESYMTTGSIYLKVIQDERALKYGGKTVSVVPEIPLAIIEQIKKAGKKEKADILLIEIGGTLGEYQNILFLEAARILKQQEPKNVLIGLVSYLPVPTKVGEMKTKPTQQAVTLLRNAGLNPDFIIGRSVQKIDEKRKEKIAFHSNLKKEDIVSGPDVDSIYQVPEIYLDQNLDKIILKKLNLKNKKIDGSKLKKWQKFTNSILKSKKSKKKVKIAIIGKYFDTGDFVLSDAYISVIEALKFSSFKKSFNLEIDWINSKKLERNKKEVLKLKKYDGVLVPGGFGKTGVEGKIKAIEFVRKNKIPFLGICYGMQLATIEFARNVAKLKNANSAEIDSKAKYKIVDIIESQKEKIQKNNYGGTMRLGSYPAVLKDDSLIKKIYKNKKIEERHRHRYEINPEFIDILEKKGLIFSAKSPNGILMEAIELNQEKHPFFLAVQYHPELKSRPIKSQPLFDSFLEASFKNKKYE